MNISKIIAIRRASEVKRLHTHPLLQEHYTNGQHSYGVAMLVDQLYPVIKDEFGMTSDSDDSDRLTMIQAALYHDVAEKWTGDIPGSFKAMQPIIKDVESSVSQDVLNQLNVDINLSEEKYFFLKCCDKLELLLFCMDERELGSKRLNHIIENLMVWFGERNDDLPIQIVDFLHEVLSANYSRLGLGVVDGAID